MGGYGFKLHLIITHEGTLLVERDHLRVLIANITNFCERLMNRMVVMRIGFLDLLERNRFGNIPEVQTFVAYEERRKFGIPIKDVGEYMNFLEAQYTLWPEEVTLKTLETLQNEIAEGKNIIFRRVEAP